MKRKIAVEIISFLFIFLFVYAALNKLLDVEKFRVQIGQSPLLTDIAPFVAWFIPVTEIAVALMMSIFRFRLIGFYAAFGLMVIFTAYIVAILKFNEHIPCSCGGVLQSMSWTEHLIFNVCFVLLALAGVMLDWRQESKEGKSLKELQI